MWRETWLMPYVSVIANLTVNILLVQWIGLPGVILSSIAALVLVEIPWETTVFFKQFFQRKVYPYLLDVLRSVVTTVIAVAVVGGLSHVMAKFIVSDILTLAVRVVFCLVATALVCLPAIKKANLKSIVSVIKKK